MPDPSISVVIPTRDRPIRLRWLLNSLREQTIGIRSFEVIVANGSRGTETTDMLREHSLTRQGVLRELRTGEAHLPLQRDLGWRASRGPLVAFTDDDCRAPADWLERALEAAAADPVAVLQGSTVPDPDEVEILWHAPHARSQQIAPPTVWAQTCNIVYPRSVLERVDGFNVNLHANFAGDDTDLALRARASGAGYRAAAQMVIYHAVHDGTILDRIASGWRWGDLPYLVRRHPQLRDELPLRCFWKPTHAPLLLALGGLTLARRNRLALLLVLPWAKRSSPSYSSPLRGRLRAVSELPSRALIDAAEIAALARGSIRHRTLLL